MKRFFFLFLITFASCSFAVEWNKATDFVWNIGTGKIDVFPGAGSGNVWAAGELKASPFGPTLARQKALPFNPSPTANFKSTFTPKAIAKAVLSPTSAIINLALYVGVSKLLEGACVRGMGGTMSLAPGGQWEECQTITRLTVTYEESDPADWSPGYPAAMQAYMTKMSKPGQQYETRSSNCTGGKTTDSYDFHAHPQDATYMVITTERVSTCTDYNSSPKHDIAYKPARSKTSTYKDPTRFQPTSAPMAQAAIEQTLTGMSQADFSNGYHGTTGQAGHVVDDIIQSGNGIEPDIEVSGPLSSSPVTSTTVNTTNNTTTTTTTTNNYTYAKQSPLASSVSNVSVTSTSTVNNSTGSVTNNSTTTQTPDPTDAATDTALSAVPKLYQPKYPQGLVGVWKDKSAEFSQSPVAKLMQVINFNVGSGGGCPHWPLSIEMLGHNFGTYETSPPCSVWTFLKWAMLLTTAFLVRALIFGG